MHIVFGIVVIVALHIVGAMVIQADPFGFRAPAVQMDDRWHVVCDDHHKFGQMWYATYNGLTGYGCSSKSSVEVVVRYLNGNDVNYMQVHTLFQRDDWTTLTWLGDIGEGRKTEYHDLPRGLHEVLPAIERRAWEEYRDELLNRDGSVK